MKVPANWRCLSFAMVSNTLATSPDAAGSSPLKNTGAYVGGGSISTSVSLVVSSWVTAPSGTCGASGGAGGGAVVVIVAGRLCCLQRLVLW